MTDPRIDAAKVKAIIQTVLDDVAVQNHIDTAHLMVETLLLDQEYADEILTRIELYLAAHLVTIQDPRDASTADRSYLVKVGMGLDGSAYGQMAQALDYKKVLSSGQKETGRASLTSLVKDDD
jgi:hypothetical protein